MYSEIGSQNLTDLTGSFQVTGITESLVLNFYTDSYYEDKGWHMTWRRKFTFTVLLVNLMELNWSLFI